MGVWVSVGAVFAVAYIAGLVAFSPTFLQQHHRTLELVIWLLGATSLLTLVIQSQRATAEPLLPSYQGWVVGASMPLQIEFGSSYWCRDSERTEFSPQNYDEIVEAFREACNWRATALPVFQAIDFSEIPELPAEIADGPEFLKGGPLDDEYREYETAVLEYNTFRSEYLSVKATVDRGVLDTLLDLIAPYLFAVAAAFSGAKILRSPRGTSL